MKKWTDEMISFLRAEMPLKTVGTIPELLKLLNVIFDTGFTITAMKTKMQEERIQTGIMTSHIKPNFNQRELYSERKKKGLWQIKIAEPNVWRQKQVYLYEQYNNTSVPKGNVVIFLDGNVENFEKDNLFMLSRGENGLVNYLMHNIPRSKALTKIFIGVAKLKIAKIKAGEKHDLTSTQRRIKFEVNESARIYRAKRKMEARKGLKE